jgi:hypothetical protein
MMMNGYGVITHVGHIAHKSFTQFPDPHLKGDLKKPDPRSMMMPFSITFQQSTSNVFGENRT